MGRLRAEVSDRPSRPSFAQAGCVATVTNINDVLDGHVALEIECVDRLYLNAYVPNLQVGGQVVSFFTSHRGDPIPSPALMEKNGNRFRREVKAFAAANSVPILTLKKPDRSRLDDRKLDHVRPHLERAERAGRFGVVAIVATQEFQWVFTAKDRSPKPGVVSYDFVKEERRVGTYYFYVLDADFGPGFIKLCTYFPYPAKVWANGHEWAKRQADRAGVRYRALTNGFAVINKPSDIGVLARLEHLPELIAKARAVNRRLLMIERAGQGCAIGSALFERIHQPYIREGQLTGALRFGDPRAMALTGALCVFVHAVAGFTNKSLRWLVAGLLGIGTTPPTR